MNPNAVVHFVSGTRRRSGPSDAPARGPTPPSPAPPPTGTGRSRHPEPPVFRSNPLSTPRACVSCATPLSYGGSTPRCWGCGRALCLDCYWRHGVEPSAHRCASCLAASTSAAAVSGGRSVTTRNGFAPTVPPTKTG